MYIQFKKSHSHVSLKTMPIGTFTCSKLFSNFAAPPQPTNWSQIDLAGLLLRTCPCFLQKKLLLIIGKFKISTLFSVQNKFFVVTNLICTLRRIVKKRNMDLLYLKNGKIYQQNSKKFEVHWKKWDLFFINYPRILLKNPEKIPYLGNQKRYQTNVNDFELLGPKKPQHVNFCLLVLVG